jgi:hypothetical protein
MQNKAAHNQSSLAEHTLPYKNLIINRQLSVIIQIAI